MLTKLEKPLVKFGATILKTTIKPWASITFAGTRETFDLEFSDAQTGRDFVEDVTNRDFDNHTHLCASVDLLEISTDNNSLTCTVQMLMLRKA